MTDLLDERVSGGQGASRSAHDGPRRQAEDSSDVLAQTWIELQAEVSRRSQAEAALELRTAQLKDVTAELAQAEQHERECFAEMLHDHLQQLLVAAKLKIARLAGSTNKQELDEAVREANGLLDEAINQTRSLAMEINPPVLHEGGLLSAIEWLAQWMRQKHGLKIEVTADEHAVEAGDEKMRNALFGAVRELLFNVAKHAKATTANVEVQRVGDQIRIVVADRGMGFDALLASASGIPSVSQGLFKIRKRLDLLGGRFEIDSIPGKGRRFTLQAPIEGWSADGAAHGAEPGRMRSEGTMEERT